MISIIIAFHKGRNYLKDCLDSIRNQKYKDIETIIVKDMKALDSSENIDELISEYLDDSNVKVLELKNKTGVSAARNLGIENAKGEYVYFLDSDDYVMEDTFTNLLEAVDTPPDGLKLSKNEIKFVYGRIFHTWFMRAAFNIEQGNVDEDEKLIEENPEKFADAVDYKFAKCNRIEEVTCLGTLYNRDFLNKSKIRFDEEQKLYGDVTFLVNVFAKDGQYSYCKDSIYVKRYHNDEINLPSIDKLEDENRDGLMAKAYIDAFRICREKKVTFEIKDALAKIFAKFYIDDFSRRFHDKKDQITDEKIKIFSEALKEFDKSSFKGLGVFEKKIIKAGAAADKEKIKKWSNIRLIKNKIIVMFSSRKHLYRTLNVYIFSKMKQKDNWIIFESFVGRNYSGQPKYIYQYLQKNYGKKYKYIWIVNDKKLEIDGKHTKVKRFGLKYYYYMTRSKYWVNNMRQPYAFPKRDSQIMLETWHGTPLKRLVFDMDDVHSANPKYKQIVYKQSRKWDYLLSDNGFSTEVFQSCFMFDKEKILELGYPANDPMYDKNLDVKAAELKRKIGVPLDKKVLLYAPTWRDDNMYGAGEYKFELALDLNRLHKEFGDEYVILLRMHYWVVDQLDLNGLEDFVINVSKYSDITDIYLISDICMTDYSSVFFDYANLRRPILFYMYDLEKYRDVLRGFYLDINKDLPGPILTTNDEVVDALKNIDEIKRNYNSKYETFYNRFCHVDDGNAAKRVCEKVFK